MPEKRFKALPIPFRYVLLTAVLLIFIFVLQAFISYSMRQRESFQINETSFTSYIEEGMPDSIAAKLEPLQNEEFWGERDFLNALMKFLSEDEAMAYTSMILKYSRRAPEPFNWLANIQFTASNYILWAFLTPLLYYLLTLFPLDKSGSWTQKIIHLLLSVFVSAFHEVFSTFIYFFPMYLSGYLTITPEFMSHVTAGLPAGVISRFVEYWLIIGVLIAISYYRQFRSKQLELLTVERELSKAQLNALKMQLHPHFLFNTLHTISSLMEKNIEDAQSVVSKLGHLLRNILEQDQRNTIPLADEIKYISSYLDIEQVRFNDRLKVVYEIPADTLKAAVPNLILQPLVENAVKHGFSRRTDAGKIRVASQRDGDRLILTVEDDGKGIAEPASIQECSGIGIKNVKGRLKEMYKGDFQFEIASPNQEGFIARIVIPFQLAQGEGIG